MWISSGSFGIIGGFEVIVGVGGKQGAGVPRLMQNVSLLLEGEVVFCVI